MDEQEPHRNRPGAGLSSFNGVFADKGVISGHPEPGDEAEQKQQRSRAAFKERLEPIVVGSVDELGNKIGRTFVERVDARKGAEARANGKVAPHSDPGVSGDPPSSVFGKILHGKPR